jgi:hypothetical protein
MLDLLNLAKTQLRERVTDVRGHLTRQRCPYCFGLFYLHETPFLCKSDRCVRERPDPPDRTIAPSGSISNNIGRERLHSACNHRTNVRLCPRCGVELPFTTGQLRNLVISIVGAKNAGKTHYLPVLIETLKESVGPSLKLTLSPINEETLRRYNRDYRDPLYKGQIELDVTRSGLTDARVREPLLFKLCIFEDHDGQRKLRDAVVLALFDTAGEDMDSQEVLAQVNKYIPRSDGIILLLDPLQLDFVRDRFSAAGGALPPMTTDTSEIVSRLMNLIHSGSNLSASTQINVPLAVTLSKFDTVGALVDRQLVVSRPSHHGPGFDVADSRAVNDEVQSLIDQWGGRYLVEQVRGGFKQSAFFALSALGNAPQATTVANRPVRVVPTIRPMRVVDPFLWILHSHKLIQAKV